MSELSVILSQIKPCDTKKPYLFISYSSQDCESVWPDVLRLQQDGWNVWLDEKNLDKTKASWNEDALRIINSRYCKLLVFYASSNSLRSEACLKEWRETQSMRTLRNHRGEVPTLVVEAEPIDDIMQFCEKIQAQMTEEIEDDERFEEEVDVLCDFQEKLFQNCNDRVRIRAKKTPGAKIDYYEDMQRNFPSSLKPWVSGDMQKPCVPTDEKVQTESAPAACKPKVSEQPAAALESSLVGDLHIVKTLGPTDIKYHICTFGSRFDIGAGAPVTLVMGDKRYERRMHNRTKGRVDGLKQFYTDHGLQLGDVLDARYCAAENTIYLTRKDAVL